MHSSAVRSRKTTRLPAYLLVLTLSFFHLTAKADLWTFVDDNGITHFAAEQVDARYKLFFKGADFTKLSSMGDAAAALKDRNGRIAAAQQQGTLSKRFADLDRSKGYKAAQKHLQVAAKAHQVDYELLKAVVAAESGFDPVAVSPKGAVGLMQLMPTTAEQYGVLADKGDRKDKKGKLLPARSIEEKLTDPQTNINAGARYLSYLIKLFKGDTQLAVAAYNAGEGAVQRAGNKIPNYKETQGYVKTVMGLYGVFKPGAATVVASAAGAQPVAAIVSRVNSRVRVELGTAAKGRAAPPESARAVTTSAAGADSSSLVPVLYTVPADGGDSSASSAAGGASGE